MSSCGSLLPKVRMALRPLACVTLLFCGFATFQYAVDAYFVIHGGPRLARPLYRGGKIEIAKETDPSATILLRRRSVLYASLMASEGFFEGGMVTNLAGGDQSSFSSQPRLEGECDSLLFTGLYYAAMSRLVPEESRDVISHEGTSVLMSMREPSTGYWRRHPKCNDTPTSRDMMLGLLFAADALEHSQIVLRTLFWDLGRHGGFFDDGPINLSFLSPGLMRLLSDMADRRGIDPLPRFFVDETLQSPQTFTMRMTGLYRRLSFSTLDFDAIVPQRGFRSHLIALTILMEHASLLRSNAGSLDGQSAIALWRLRLLAMRLFRSDPQNLLYEAVYLKTVNQLDINRDRLAGRILAMPEFPPGRLPTDCDRGADFLWQRDSEQWAGPAKSSDQACLPSVHYSGVDLIFITSIVAPVRPW